MGRLWFLAVLCLTTVGGCGVSDDPTRVNDFTALTAIEIRSQNPRIAAQTSNQFKAIGNFSDVFTRDITADVTWSSLDETIATIRDAAPSKGRARGLAAGVVTIVAQLGEVSASIDFEVTDATIAALSVSPTEATLVSGATLTLSASGLFSDGTTQSLTADVVWASGDAALLTVSNELGSEGQAMALGPVSADTAVAVTAEFPPSAPAATATSTLTVSPTVLESLSVTAPSTTLDTLVTQQFSASGLFSDGTTSDLTAAVTWSSGDSSIALIDSAGLATTLRVGTTSIRADLNGVSAVASLTVTGSSLTSVTVTPSDPVAEVGGAILFTADGIRSDATSADITELVTWSSSNTAVATISNDAGTKGDATALSAGTSQISAALGSFSVPVTLTVNTP